MSTDQADWPTGESAGSGGASTAASDEPLARRYVVFAIVAVGLFMSSVDQTVVATALPTIQHDLHTSVQWGGWTITIYALGQVLVMPLAGKISDMFGRKRVFLTAAAVFAVASLLCGIADNIYLLVGLRALQSIGGGAFMPSASGMVADHFGRDRDRALGMFTSIFPIGGVVGPILGGLFVTYSSWRGIFLVNVPISAALIVVGVIFLPRSTRERASTIDIAGIVLLGLTILGAMFGITELGDGVSAWSPSFVVPEILAALCAVALVLHTRRTDSPFIARRMLVGRAFGVMNLVNFLFGAAATGFSVLIPLYSQERFGIQALAAGTLLTARAVGVICVAGLAVVILRRTGYRVPMVIGFLTIAVGLAMMCLPPPDVPVYAWLSISAGITGLGAGFAMPSANNATLQLSNGEVASVAGLRGMFRQGGAIVAVSITTAVAAKSQHPGLAIADTFLVYVAVLVCAVPFIFLVPEHRGRW